jgi:hypothetical protein
MPKKNDRYDEIVARLVELDEATIANANEKDAAIRAYRKKQKSLNQERAALNEELIKVIKADPERVKLYQARG